jgi:hypothetical protein
MSNVVLLIGCSSIAGRIRRAGWQTVEADYFWRSPIDLEVVAAVVDFSVGGGTGLAVADRLKRRLVVPMILFRPEDRDCVLPRFHGAEQPRGAEPGPELEAVLELCSHHTRALRSRWQTAETTPLTVSDSMIIAVETCSGS